MNKAQILILLILIALIVYYFSSKEKTSQKPSSRTLIKPNILPNSLPIKPFMSNTLLVNCPLDPIKPLPTVFPSEIIKKKNQSTPTMPINLPEKEPVYH